MNPNLDLKYYDSSVTKYKNQVEQVKEKSLLSSAGIHINMDSKLVNKDNYSIISEYDSILFNNDEKNIR